MQEGKQNMMAALFCCTVIPTLQHLACETNIVSSKRCTDNFYAQNDIYTAQLSLTYFNAVLFYSRPIGHNSGHMWAFVVTYITVNDI